MKQNMNEYLIDFQGMKWESQVSGVRYKAFIIGEQRLRLVEFSEEFFETDWCTKEHIGYVIAGSISIDFDGKLVNLKSGDGLFIPKGEANKHKGRIAKGDKALIVFFEKV